MASWSSAPHGSSGLRGENSGQRSVSVSPRLLAEPGQLQADVRGDVGEQVALAAGVGHQVRPTTRDAAPRAEHLPQGEQFVEVGGEDGAALGEGGRGRAGGAGEPAGVRLDALLRGRGTAHDAHGEGLARLGQSPAGGERRSASPTASTKASTAVVSGSSAKNRRWSARPSTASLPEEIAVDSGTRGPALTNASTMAPLWATRPTVPRRSCGPTVPM